MSDTPTLARWLARFVRDDIRDAVLGDVLELAHVRRIDERGRVRRELWYCREMLFAILHFPAPLRSVRAHGDGFMLGFMDDVRRGVRTLARAPMHALLSVLTLGVGIGAATAIFSVADPIVLRPLPFPSPDRLVFVWEMDAEGLRSNVGYATFNDVVTSATTVDRAAAIGGWDPTLFSGGTPAQVRGLRVSSTYFATLGVHPALGRDFAAEEDVQARNGVVILAHELWRDRFGSDSSLVGRMIDVGGRQMLVAGVMPADYDDVMRSGTRIWRVLGYDATLPFACRSCRQLRMIARPKASASMSAMSQELNAISTRLVAANPRDYPHAGFTVVDAQQEVTRRIRPVIAAILASVALLVVIAVVNVGGLQLARALRRDGEFAVRVALGAGTGRLVRQLLAEGLVVGVGAGAFAIVMARGVLSSLVNMLPSNTPRLAAIHLDVRALAVASTLAIIGGLSLGILPAWHARRAMLSASLKSVGRVVGAHRARALLVVSEIALAVALLCAAGLLTRSLRQLLDVSPGISVSDVATAQVMPSGPRYNDPAAVLAWQDQVIEAARAVPGVEDAALTSQLPLGGNMDAYGIQAEDKPLANPELAPSADRYTVTANFLRTMRIPVLDGRDFEAADNHAGAAPVAIVSAALARRIWHGEPVVGKRIHIGEPTRPWYTVIGVAGDVHHRALDNEQTQQVYIPTRAFFFTDNAVDVVVRTSGNPSRVLEGLRSAVSSPDKLAVVTRLQSMSDVVRDSTAQRRLLLVLFTVFAGFALFLAGAGVFGALAGMVAERTREFGLRGALGASPRNIAGMVLRQAGTMALLGAACGIAISLASRRVIAGVLFGVEATDPLTLGGVLVVTCVAATAASLVPVLRAVRVEPMRALRAD